MRAIALSLLLLAPVACDGDEPEPASVVVDAGEPCAFATPAEIAAAVEGQAGESNERTARGPGDVVLCHYEVGPPYSSVTLNVETSVSEGEFRRRMERDPLNTDPLDGYGAAAFTHGGVNVVVWEDDQAVSAGLQHLKDADRAREALEGLAGLIDEKL